MKVWPFLSVLFLSALLAACCPAPLAEQPTAFRGVVVGVSAEVSALHLRQNYGTSLITLTVPKSGVRTASGELLPLEALHAGDTVYVRGALRGGELEAYEVQRLKVQRLE